MKSHRSAKLLDPNRFAKLREIEVLLSLYLPNIKSAWPIIFFCSICPLILGVKFSAQKCVKFISQFDLIFLYFILFCHMEKVTIFFSFGEENRRKRG